MNRFASYCLSTSAVCRSCRVRRLSPRAFSTSFRSCASTTSVTNTAKKTEKTDPQSILKTKKIGSIIVNLPEAKKQVSLYQFKS